MPRRGSISKRDVLPDPLYNSKLVTKLVNNVMYDGKKGVAQTICMMRSASSRIRRARTPWKFSSAALDNIKPELEVKARRVGGSTYQSRWTCPDRKQTLALRWLISYARSRLSGPWRSVLAGEILDAKNSMGGAFKKKEETHRMAEANKAFAH